MADRALRGSNLGSRSMESDENVVPSERQLTTYVCAQGHRTELPFSVEADVPRPGSAVAASTRSCRAVARARRQARQARAHALGHAARASLDPELEELLEERLTLLRESRGEKPRRKIRLTPPASPDEPTPFVGVGSLPFLSRMPLGSPRSLATSLAGDLTRR